MKIQVLGVGGAFSPKLGNSSFIIWDKSDKKEKGLLIDCGYTVFPMLQIHNLLDKISRVFITHFHGDHAGSLDTLLQYRRFVLGERTKLIGIATTMSYLQNIDSAYDSEIDEYFEQDVFEAALTLVTPHCMGTDNTTFLYEGLLISGDTIVSLLEHDVARRPTTKVIFHDVDFSNRSPVHASYDKLREASSEIKAKTWLYHYKEGDYHMYKDQVNKDGFAGILRKGQILGVE